MESMLESSLVVDPTSKKIYWLLMAGVLLLLVWPVLEFQYPSLVDYPGHLARVKVLRDWNHETVLQQRYEIIRKPFPNLALDLLGVYVFSWLDVRSAGKASLILLLIVFWAGCHFLGRETGRGRIVWLAPVAALLVYNSTFLYGYINYNFGIALFLLALPAWLWWRRERSFLSNVVATFLTTATYLAHLIGIGVLAVAMIFLTALDCWRRRWRKEFVVDLLPLVPSAVLYASLGRNRGDTSTIIWGSLALKATHMMAWLITYNSLLTALYAIAWIAALAIILCKGRKWAGSKFLALGGLLSVLAVVLPAQQLFYGTDADARLVIPALAVTLLALVVDMPRIWARVAFILVLGAMCARVVEIRYYWRAGDALTRAQLELFWTVPKGGSVFPIVWLPDDVVEAKRERHIWHGIEYATVDNLVFFPQFFSVRGQQPVMLRDASYTRITPEMPVGVVPWEAIFRDYDFIYAYGVDDAFQRYLDGQCDQIGTSGKGRMYRVRKLSP